MKSVKRILGLILVSMLLMTMILPVTVAADTSASLDDVTRDALTVVPGKDATFLGEKLNLNFPGVTFTSSDSAIINPATGAVTRGQQTKNVTLTATADGASKDFAFRVPGLFESDPVESIVYYDDFEDGVLDSRIETTSVSQATMETKDKNGNGILDLKSNSSGTGTTAQIWLKSDKTQVDGDLHLDFVVKRDYVYDNGFRVYFYGKNASGDVVNGAEVDIASINPDYSTNVWIGTGATNAETGDAPTSLTVSSPNTYRFNVDIDGETGGFELYINGTKLDLSGDYLKNNLKGLAYVSIMAMTATTDPWMESFSCIEEKVPSTESVIYYDDFEDGVLDSRIEITDYSQATMEANGKLNFTSNSSAGEAEHGTGVINFKNDKTAVDGKFKVAFELKRDAYVYAKTRIYFTGPNGYCFYLDWCGTVYGTTNTQIRLTTFDENGSPVDDDVQDMTASVYVGTLKVVAEIDNTTGAIDLTINNITYPLTNGGYLRAGTTVSNINITTYHTSTDPQMTYFSCTKPIDKESVSNVALDYNAFDKKVTIVSPAAQGATVIAAAYSGTEGNATLVSAVPVPTTLVKDGSVTVDTSALNVSGASFIKLYLWDSITSLRPFIAPAYVSDLAAN